ncbi:MAG: TonB-dependent hemoglobin/transferrin/lactoferrin family receptor [Betaproteobacteria bacterium]
MHRRAPAHPPVRWALLLAALASPAQAQQDATLGDVVVTATRTEAQAQKVPATITRTTREEMDRRLPTDESELFEDAPDMAFGRDARRFGATRPNIRGIEDNRVLQLVDGIRLPSFYNGGGPTNFTMNAPLGPSLEFLRRAEVLRGPASSLYGSDAIGGVVGYLTLEPRDLLGAGEGFGGRAGLGAAGANDGITGTVLGAGQGESLDWLVGYTHTRAHEFDNQGDVDTVSATRTRPNPQDVRDRGAIAKLGFRPAAGHKLTLGLEARDQDVEVEVLRLSASLPKVTETSGDDHVQRARASLEWEHKAPGGWYLTTRLYQQESDTQNYNRQARTNTSATCSAAAGTGNNCRVEQDFFFEQRATGAGVQLEKALAERHLLTYGADLSRVRTEELRDVRVFNLTTGTFSKSLAGDTFPLRDFAPGITDTLGLFVQDEIVELAGGRLTLVPGLRYDRTQLKAEVDALSQAVLTAIGKQAVSQTNDAFSPKLAALWRFSPALTGYGQAVRGFRAPNYEEVNGHFRNAVQSYGISPNPDLKPETSTGVELGLRLDSPRLRGQIAVFDNRYSDFISVERLTCPTDPRCIAGVATTFMPVNLAKVRVYGAEARVAWEFIPGWRAQAALAHARGTDESADQPLDTVEPTRLALGLARDAGTWGAEARVRAAAAVKRVNDTSGGTPSPWFRPPAYEVLDLSAWWRPWRSTRLALAVNNVFDRKYWLWSDIRLADARNPAGVDFYSQPGRNLAARLEHSF